MFELIQPTPPNLIAVKAVGKIEDADYKTVLALAVDKMVAEQGKARLVFEIGDEFDGFTAHAVLDDAALGIEHWRDFEKIALVTDHSWIAGAVRMFAPYMPAQVKLFGLPQRDDALAWAAN
ncbi:STAS/SEC14 domain-containing protein [Sulfitobacter pseudonitzschiae]|uniref:STAS/SEC14 domain-containing protein n=1 Tax=Pseudosulfitobacter pseudonitzschiae TaxID=1402135 RepID=A0A9Q2NRG9_9RHOB|nr:STAS/SEC14 domain-containing protein [Pseudosulfitobacter pseudonitzschiae]MBM2293188.1 STAS/SEC14 domain-containing protein [Pseudosulfitobacter pseudonitzschiae]MBM2297875.1 STAS/SEC14 domain-containing protein [Pseudosulfitobacter pseudonitzschiae]MBM2302789.1 STAS/SEC14 domain-containing protein [Pseudosulfitobacter pseudonitzschiae]MBM2312545.1 STAS/SEC14 domain-containing protein [Pseudosulfitobacter pseudonitzschiae]MBM2317485.1 STAS/SEC14 domain-containing protein [Pseudosulfitobact